MPLRAATRCLRSSSLAPPSARRQTCERSCPCRRRSRTWSASESRRFRRKRDRCSSSSRRSSARRRPRCEQRLATPPSTPSSTPRSPPGRSSSATTGSCASRTRCSARPSTSACRLAAVGLSPARGRTHRDLEQRARHLSLATTSPTRQSPTSSSAQRGSGRRGAPDAAASLGSRSRSADTARRPAAHIRRTFLGAGFPMEAGDVPDARARVEPLLEPSPRRRAVAGPHLQGRHRAYESRPCRAYLREAIDIAPDPRVRWQGWIRYAQQGGWISGDRLRPRTRLGRPFASRSNWTTPR